MSHTHPSSAHTRTVAHLQYFREWVFFYSFLFLLEEKKERSCSSSSNSMSSENNNNAFWSESQPVLFIVLSYALNLVLFSLLIRFALLCLKSSRCCYFHVVLLLSFVRDCCCFSRIFPSPNSIINFIQSSINVVDSQPRIEHRIRFCRIRNMHYVVQCDTNSHTRKHIRNHVARLARDKTEIQHFRWSKFRLSIRPAKQSEVKTKR